MKKALCWTPRQIALLRDLWLTPIPSSEIARKIGRSKNACCGMAKRLELPPKPNANTDQRAEARRRRSEQNRLGWTYR